MKTTSDINLYDLMSDDMTVWIKRNEKFGFDLEIEDYDGHIMVNEEGIHKYAMESFAALCRRFVYRYDRLAEAIDKEENDKIGGDK